MVTYKVLYWQEVAVQMHAEWNGEEASVPLSPRFMERVDVLVEERGLLGTDDYLAQWRWCDEAHCQGDSAIAVAEAIKQQLEMQADW